MNAMNPLKPPPSSAAVREARALLDLVTMSAPLVRSFLNRSQPPRQQAVMVIPGFGADDRYTWPLRTYLKSLGYATTGWGLGTNRAGLNMPHSLGDVHSRWKLQTKSPYRGEAGVPYVIDRLIDRVDEIYEESKQPIALIGWSLGGYMAREVARDRPAQISQVITLGTPVIGGPQVHARGAGVPSPQAESRLGGAHGCRSRRTSHHRADHRGGKPFRRHRQLFGRARSP